MLSRLQLILRQAIAPSSLHYATMATFVLPNSDPAITVSLTPDLSREQLLCFPAFKIWIETLQNSLRLQRQNSHAFQSAPYILRSINVQAVDFFGGGKKLGFVKLTAEVSNEHGEKLPGSVLLRGGSVAMMVHLPLLRPLSCGIFQTPGSLLRTRA